MIWIESADAALVRVVGRKSADGRTYAVRTPVREDAFTQALTAPELSSKSSVVAGRPARSLPTATCFTAAEQRPPFSSAAGLVAVIAQGMVRKVLPGVEREVRSGASIGPC
jgi:hypothetical protein